jgi:hypothetical protein
MLAVALERREHASGHRPQPGEARRARHRAAMRLQVFREDRFGHLLGDPDVEAVAAVGLGEFELTQNLAARAEAGRARPYTPLEEVLGEPERLEDLHRARVDHRRPVPSERRVARVDEEARDVPPRELSRQEEPRRAGTDDRTCGRSPDVARPGAAMRGY